jgi:hypothetical protein
MARRSRRTILLLLLALLIPQLGTAKGGRAREPVSCLPGRFLLSSPLPARTGLEAEALELDADGTLTIGDCTHARADVHAGRRWTRVHAAARCERPRKVHLTARIGAPQCTSLHGMLHGPFRPVPVSAARSSCGDGVLDTGGGEQCDASQAGGDTPCPDSCGAPSSATPCQCEVIESAPRGLAAAIDGDEVALHWTPPDPASGNHEVQVLRRLNAPPVDAADPLATLVFAGGADHAADLVTGLLPDTRETARTYHYAAFGCTAAGACETAGSRATLTPTLSQVLGAGGYNVHWRHSAATTCNDSFDLGTAANATVPDWWKSCENDCAIATARQLNAAGMTEATTIGVEMRRLGVPFGRVLSSEFCRNTETAVRMALGPVPETLPSLTLFVYQNARCADTYALLGEVPEPGTNTALIGHSGFGSPLCPVLESLQWSEAAIFKPDGLGGAEFVTRVLWNAWSALP